MTEWLTLGRAIRHQPFWALQDVSFEVARGECVAIVGPNGSGKSTLLKILTGVLLPSTGTAEVRGRVLSLLELGTGFNPQLTGRQNVVHSAGLLSLPEAYAAEKMPQIEAFAELGEFFDRPVRLYSSGMFVRLAFSMFTAFEPEVFIVDEALSVGDVFFQQKCVRRIEEMRSRGVTMLFVSHDAGAVQRLCQRAIFLRSGRVHFIGAPEEALSRYHASLGLHRAPGAPVEAQPKNLVGAAETDGESAVPDPLANHSAATAETSAAQQFPSAESETRVRAHDLLIRARSRHGARDLVLAAASVFDLNHEPTTLVAMDGTLSIHVVLVATRATPGPSVGLHLFDRNATLVFATSTGQLGATIGPMAAEERRVIVFRLTLSVQPGPYTFSLGCGEPSQDGPDVGLLQDRHEGLGPIQVTYSGPTPRPFYGVARLPCEVSL